MKTMWPFLHLERLSHTNLALDIS